MPNSTLPPGGAAAPAASSRPRRSALNVRPGAPGPGSGSAAGAGVPRVMPGTPGFAASLLPDDPDSVPGADRWTRPAPPATTHTERLVAGLAAVLAQMQATARPLTRPLRRRAVPVGVPGYGPLPPSTASLRLPGFRRFWFGYLGLLAGGVAVVLLGLRIAVAGWTELATRLEYGPIRTSHLAVYFGIPEEGPTAPSLVTAVNDHGVGHVFVLPGGQAAHASVVEIPGGDPAGTLPLLLQAADVDRDGHPDLVVAWGPDSAPGVFLFDTGTLVLRPPTAAEQGRLWLPGAGR